MGESPQVLFRVRVQIHIQGLRLGFRGSVQGKGSVLLLGFVLKCKGFSLGSGLQDPFQGLSSGLRFGFRFRCKVSVWVQGFGLSNSGC